MATGLLLEGRRYTDFSSPNPELRYSIDKLGYPNGSQKDVLGCNFLFLQHYIDMELGRKNVKFNMQVGFTVQCSGPTVESELPVYMTLGIVLYHFPQVGWWK